MATSQNSKDQKTIGSQGANQPTLPQDIDIDELMQNPKFQDFLNKKVDERSEEVANKKFNELTAMQSINRGEFFAELISTYVYEGKQKTKKDDNGNQVPIYGDDGKPQTYPNKYYITFSSKAFGEKQLEIESKKLFERFKDSEEILSLIVFYKLASNPFDPRAINPIVTNILTLSEYQSTLSK